MRGRPERGRRDTSSWRPVRRCLAPGNRPNPVAYFANVPQAEEIREHLVRALHADLVGPFDLDDPAATEALRLPHPAGT